MKRKHLIPRILAVLEIGCVLALGNNSEGKAREEMVRSQLVAGGIRNHDVRQALSEVPGHESSLRLFVLTLMPTDRCPSGTGKHSAAIRRGADDRGAELGKETPC
jgi:hypothetical protein